MGSTVKILFFLSDFYVCSLKNRILIFASTFFNFLYKNLKSPSHNITLSVNMHIIENQNKNTFSQTDN